MADKNDRFEITKPLMAQADRDRCFYGSIQRGQDLDGYPVSLTGLQSITASQWLMAGHRDELGVAAG